MSRGKQRVLSIALWPQPPFQVCHPSILAHLFTCVSLALITEAVSSSLSTATPPHSAPAALLVRHSSPLLSLPFCRHSLPRPLPPNLWLPLLLVPPLGKRNLVSNPPFLLQK